MKIIASITLFLFLIVIFGEKGQQLVAQEKITFQELRAIIVDIPQDVQNINVNETPYIIVLSGDLENKITAFADPKMGELKIGDKVLVFKSTDIDGTDTYYITDHMRLNTLAFVFLLFITIVLLISKKAGLMSLLGMAYSFFVIFKFLIPQLYSGNNPILITLFTIILIAPITFVLSHGFNSKSLTALGATVMALTLTSVLALIFVNTAHLSGFGTEEAYFLQIAKDTLNIKGIFLAGIIIGTLGILDDATVTQTSIVAQLKTSSRNMPELELFKKAMAVGHDHIASTVNTLVLVYTGASLPLLLLFTQSSEFFVTALNNQVIAEEILTMLVSSIGLIISIPIATILAVYLVPVNSNKTKAHYH